jgi:16S rRNA (uracil1498-N3)-methyltransferase
LNLVLVEEAEVSSDGRRAQLRGRRAEHLLVVVGVERGSRVRAGVVGGRLGTAEVVHAGPHEVELELDLSEQPPRSLPVTLVLALPRPKVLRRVVRAVTTLGIKRLFLVGAWRVEKSYWQSTLLTATSIRNDLIAGLEQACDTVLPQVELRTLFKPFVVDELPSLAAGTTALLAHPGAARTCPATIVGPATLAVGPDAGFNDYEVGLLDAAGLSPVRLGTRLLDVETAVAALIGRLL